MCDSHSREISRLADSLEMTNSKRRMFTGIISEVGTIRDAAPRDGERDIVVACSEVLPRLHPGSSISVNGVCLTVQEVTRDAFSSRLMPHTVSVSTLGAFREGDQVNLETALRYGDELGGHLVYGHVDGIGSVQHIETGADATLFTIMVPSALLKYVVRKGAIAIDGVSLTVAELSDSAVTVSIVPFTLEHTLFVRYGIGAKVNIEVDMMAKHLEQLIKNP